MAVLQRSFEQRRELRDPGLIRAIFSSTWLAPLWLVARLYLGYQWLLAGSHKVWGAKAAGLRSAAPTACRCRSFWQDAVAIPQTGSASIKLRLVSQVPDLHARSRLVSLVRVGHRARRGHRSG